MKKIATVLFIFLLFSLVSCSSSYSSKKLKPLGSAGTVQSADVELQGVQVSQYLSGSTKTQPELTNYYSEEKDLSVLEKWLEKAGGPIDLPVDKNIAKIQTVAFFMEMRKILLKVTVICFLLLRMVIAIASRFNLLILLRLYIPIKSLIRMILLAAWVRMVGAKWAMPTISYNSRKKALASF